MKDVPNRPMDVARCLEHTLLAPEAAETDILRLCDEAVRHGFHAVCVRPEMVAVAAARLAGREPVVVSVAGFPSGLDETAVKARHASEAVAAGAAEVDVVLNRQRLKAHDYAEVVADLRAVIKAAEGRPVKVILETAALDLEGRVLAAGLACAAGASFVKTSTGYGPGGATVEDVALLRRIVGPDVKLKASGGIRSFGQALALLAAGADRLGTSHSLAIVGAATPAHG